MFNLFKKNNPPELLPVEIYHGVSSTKTSPKITYRATAVATIPGASKVIKWYVYGETHEELTKHVANIIDQANSMNLLKGIMTYSRMRDEKVEEIVLIPAPFALKVYYDPVYDEGGDYY
jgi:hypothetical protein